jgi:acyl carrier protein phosphodiesterase
MHRYEQMPEIQEVLVERRRAATALEGLAAAAKMIGAHYDALLLVAQEIDNLRAAIAEG